MPSSLVYQCILSSALASRSAELLEEKRDACAYGLVAELANPIEVHGSGSTPAFASYNYPIQRASV